MKIIIKDNFDRDTTSEILVAENVCKFYGNRIVKFLNETFSGGHSDLYFELVEDDYKLYIWEP